MRNKTLGIVAAALAIYLAFGGNLDIPNIQLPDWGGDIVTPVDPLPEPSPDMKIAVQPLIGIVPDLKDRADLSGLYRAIAVTVQRDTQVINTTSQVRALNQRAGTLLLQVTGKSLDTISPGIGEKLNTSFVTMLGLENKSLDPTTRKKCTSAFQAIAWAFEQ